MTLSPRPKNILAVTALISGLNIASAVAMEPTPVAPEQSQETIRLSKQINQQESVFSPEMLTLNLKISRQSTPTDLIPGEFKETGSDFDGFNYTLN